MNNDFLDTNVLEDYLDGKLDAKAMHYVERLSLEDPFVAEALEGLKQAPKRRQNLSLLQKQLQERVNQQPLKKKRWGIVTHRLSIAATAAVLFVTASLIFWMQESNKRAQKIAGKKVEVNLTPVVAAKKPVASADSTRLDKVIAEQKISVQASRRNAIPAPNKENLKAIAVSAMKAKEAEAQEDAARKTQILDKDKSAVSARVATAALANQAVFSGVVSQGDGQPVQGVAIKDLSNHIVATTDKNGAFKIKSDTIAPVARLKIDDAGFEAKAVTARINEPVNIVLNPASISNIPVANVDDRYMRMKVDENAGKIVMPIGGWGEFDKYLAKENKLLGRKQNDAVELQFSVQKDGTPAKFKIIKGINPEFDAEAIRLLKEGPKWSANGRNGTVRYIVKF